MKKTKLKPRANPCYLPYAKPFRDYHYISDHEDELEHKYFGDIRSLEIAFDGEYWGLFYLHGKKPTKKETINLLKRGGFDHESQNSHYTL